jgi:endonuclease/exonuclease/phosphatase family metal-dependent hydrolase
VLLPGWLGIALVSACSAQEPAANASAPARWVETARLPAPEAFQAAAADERFVYAITSTHIARYERSTGRRLAVSSPPAEHLNSGFFHEGRLWCAHSNYPRTPEQSQIKVLDPATMRLETFRDLGDYGGSLTWVVWHQGHWWCNFARYGQHNAETFLVQFDPQWREVARFTYPPAVLKHLGRYSISGGLWHRGELYVTGHDDRLLFCLRLGQAGQLELDRIEPAPFTGQGIASDPLTGGLLGIDRPKRAVVFARRIADDPPSGVRIRVMTYNIHHGEGVDGRLDLERIARVIRSAEPDLVALQEVDQRAQRTGQVDQPAELARLTGMNVVFGANIPLQGGKYGNAVLSRWPILRHENRLLPRLNEGEQRGVLDVEVQLPDGASLRLLATHFDHRPAEEERLASVRRIDEWVREAAQRPAILAGDLNAIPESAVIKELTTQWQPATAAAPTFPAQRPTRQIDYVLVRPAKRWRVVEVRVVDEPLASDHRPLLATLELLPGS